MKQIIYLDNIKKEKEFLISSWESAHNVEVLDCINETDLKRLIEAESNIDKIIFIKDYEICNPIISTIKELIPLVPTLNIIATKKSSNLLKMLESLQINLLVINNPFDDVEKNKIFEKLSINLQNDFIHEYKKIRIESLFKYQKSITDIYLLVGTDKFVKVINTGDENASEILNKYKDKKVKYLYVKRNDLEIYLEKSSEALLSAYASKPTNPENLLQLQLMSLENANASLTEIGISPIVIELSKVTMNTVMQSIQDQDDLWKTFLNTLKDGSFIGSHSIGISILSCGIAGKMKWKNEFTSRKLVTASLLHDITLSSEKIALINNEDDEEFKLLNEDEKKEFYTHPQKSAEFLKRFPGIAANVDTIILEHHERPGGKGFPRKLDSISISPLGAVLIIAEDFYHRAYAVNFAAEARSKIFDEMEPIYKSGNFKEPFYGLKSLFE